MTACVLMLSAQVSNAQLSGYFQEGFEGNFPPNGWQTVNVAGAEVWMQEFFYPHSGAAHAYMAYEFSVGEDYLITPKFSVVTGDSLIFWLTPEYLGYTDQLEIEISTTDSLTSSFGTTLLFLDDNTYPSDWTRYAVDLSAYNGMDIFIAFHHSNSNGDGILIDDVSMGTQQTNDVTPLFSGIPASVPQNTPVTPSVTFGNVGLIAQTFNVTLEIQGGYTSTQSVTALNPGQSIPVTFASWTAPGTGTYTYKAYTQLVGDGNPGNDTLFGSVFVMPSFTNSGWTTSPSLSAGSWAQATVSHSLCANGVDSNFIYNISGIDGNSSVVNSVYRFNVTTNTWENRAPIPTAVQQVSGVESQDKIYIPGGYVSSFSPTTSLQIYNTLTNTWTTGAPLPIAVGDYGIGIYKDSLIYLVSGYDGFDDNAAVQVYNISQNTWSSATAFPGIPVGAGRMSIKGNKIVFSGGYNQTLASLLDDTWVGTINPANPLQITWTAAAPYPGGIFGRGAAGVSFDNDSIVYFCGGDPDGQGTSVLGDIYGFNTVTNAWLAGPVFPNPVSNIYNLVGSERNDSTFLVLIGGYDGNQGIGSNRWLALRELDQPQIVTPNSISCGGNAVQLTAQGGASYVWSPANTLNQTTGNTVLASPTQTTSYSVMIDKGFGCTVNDTVTVAVGPAIATTMTVNSVSCFGDVNGGAIVIATGGTGSLNYAWSNGSNIISISSVAPGTYYVTVSDSIGCTALDSAVVTEPAALSSTGTGQNATSGCNGVVTVSGVTGGTAPFTYAWNDPNNQTLSSAINLCAGTYTCIVTDFNGCTDTVVVTIGGTSDVVNPQDAFVIYPVPADDYIVIKSQGNTTHINQVQLFDMLGKQIAAFDFFGQSEVQISVSDLAAGAYSVRITTSESTSQQRILIK